MIIVPIYDMMILPGVTFYFKSEILQRPDIAEIKKDEDILFIVQKSDKERGAMTADDFYPVGISGKVDNIDSEGNISIKANERVEICDIEVSEQVIEASASSLEDKEDITPEEVGQKFEKIKSSLLKFVQGFQWGVWARSFN